MKKVTKAIKLVSGLTDEEKQEFAEFFKQEEEETQEQETKEEETQEEEQEEETTEEKTVEVHPDVLKMFESLNEKIENLTKTVPKTKSFGAKKKQGEGKETKGFDDIFASLTSGQN